ncbi:hypothetical protein FRC12_000666 [Ceratobasidium sp. 428]|nr:hypothetical protein FRC12_000666 [Ceratobasidium sp. 428]
MVSDITEATSLKSSNKGVLYQDPSAILASVVCEDMLCCRWFIVKRPAEKALSTSTEVAGYQSNELEASLFLCSEITFLHYGDTKTYFSRAAGGGLPGQAPGMPGWQGQPSPSTMPQIPPQPSPRNVSAASFQPTLSPQPNADQQD